MTDTAEPIRFYWSFRSPYAWLAAEKLESELGSLGVRIEHVPSFPVGDFPNDPTRIPAKIAYMVQDVPRLARELGLRVRFPSAADTGWAFPHAAFLGAQQQGAGLAFLVAAFRKRFCEGQDLGEAAVVADAARQAGLDPDPVVATGLDAGLREQVTANWRLGMQRDGIFGVPSFVYRGRLYWGQDRMRFVRAAVERSTGVSA